VPGPRRRALIARYLQQAEYGEQWRHMLQERADMIDAWMARKSHTSTLLPPTLKVVTTSAPIVVVVRRS
jgi:hypothetical protein